MADDKTFHQERKKEKIDPSEITGNEPAATGASLEDVLAVQKAAGVEVPSVDAPTVETPQGAVTPRVKDGISVTGQLPPAMQQMLQQRMTEVQQQDGGGSPQQPIQHREVQQQLPPHQQNQPMAPGQLVTNDPALNSLLATLTTQNYEKVVLPSLGRFYQDADEPTTGEMFIRPMTGQEETILSTARFMRGGRGIEMIFNNCVQDKSVNTEKLLSVDRTYLLIYLRGISYGNIYEVSVKCPECSHQFDHDIDLNLHVDYCPDNFNDMSLTKKLPKTGFVFNYRLMTGRDETDISNYRDRKTRFSNATDDSFLYKASLLISRIGNETATVENRYGVHSLLERLPAADVNYIRNVLNDPPFGVNTEIQVLCASCAHEFPVELPYEANFFFPRERTAIEQQ